MEEEKKVRRKYDRDFIIEAVKLAGEEGNVTQVARELGISANLIYRWRSKYAADPENAFPGKGHLKPVEEENRKLKRELKRTQRERDILKKAGGHFLNRPREIYGFIAEQREKFGVGEMCRVLGVWRSGYYSWLGRERSKREQENERLLKDIRAKFRESRETYGSPSITMELKKEGKKVNRKRVARIMRENGIRAKTKKKFKITTHSAHSYPISPNLVNMDFRASEANKVWVSDITYISTREGWLYLAVILDLFSRRIVGWSMWDRLSKQLVMDAFLQAVGRRGSVQGLIFHSDRGSQYASYDFRKLLTRYGCLSSMSGKGNCYDNAVAESFFHTLKTELIYGETYATRREAVSSVFEYIEVFYNRQRRHSTNRGLSPAQFEAKVLQNLSFPYVQFLG
ncbi:MAG: IS3 family transposase [Clostridia bacterium]|nr:IS3 family transposase [Clostridia bacterium]